MLPVWFNKKREAQYHIPEELAHLTEAEKLLIQLVSPIVPLHYEIFGKLRVMFVHFLKILVQFALSYQDCQAR
jgi:hypothetical protein